MFTNSKINTFIRNHFEVLQVDLRGAKEVIDLDGADDAVVIITATLRKSTYYKT